MRFILAVLIAAGPIAVFLDQFTKKHLGVPGMNMHKPWTFKLFGHEFTLPAAIFPSTGISVVDTLLCRNDLIHGAIGCYFGVAVTYAGLPTPWALLVSLAGFLVVEIHEHDVRWDNTTMHSLGTILIVLIQMQVHITFWTV